MELKKILLLLNILLLNIEIFIQFSKKKKNKLLKIDKYFKKNNLLIYNY
jgi:hypothetical protein